MGKGAIGAPFARLLANLVVMGTGVLGRAFVEAYKQALQNGGTAAAGAAKAAKSRGGLMENEARMILNVKAQATEAEIVEAHERLTAMNDPEKGGSKYLQQKILNARELLVQPPDSDAGASAREQASK